MVMHGRNLALRSIFYYKLNRANNAKPAKDDNSQNCIPKMYSRIDIDIRITLLVFYFMLIYSLRILCLSISMLTLISASADTLRLKNGKTLNCTILKEDSNEVEITLGTGSIKIQRSRIARMDRSQTGPATSKKTDFKGNILSAQHAPKAHKKLAAEFRALMDHRNAAWDAQYMTRLHEQNVERQEKRHAELSQQITDQTKIQAELSKQLAAIELPAIVHEANNAAIILYNAKLAKKEALRAGISAIQAKFETLLIERKKTESLISELKLKITNSSHPLPKYHRQMIFFTKQYEEYKKRIKPSSQDAASNMLFEKIDRYMVKFRQEISTYKIESRQHGNSIHVKALINGQQTGVFIFDTGASSMTITESFARKLEIPFMKLPPIQAEVADGRIVNARLASLSSVIVGSAEVEDVAVIILPDGTNPTVDGLLGMSFLQHFAIALNGASGEIELTRFTQEL